MFCIGPAIFRANKKDNVMLGSRLLIEMTSTWDIYCVNEHDLF